MLEAPYRPPTTYDPEALGAQCGRCFLKRCRVGGPVPPELRGAPFAVVGEYPHENEVDDRRPFTGRSGKELTLTLKLAGKSRGEYDLIESVVCRPGGDRMDAVTRACKRANDEIDKANKAAKKEAKQAGRLLHPSELAQKWLTPQEACQPRLYAEIAQGDYAALMPVGKMAYQALLGGAKSLQDVRGGMLDGWFAQMDPKALVPQFVERSPERPWSDVNLPAPHARAMKILPTLHPSFVMHQRRWTSVFRSDVKRAVDWFTGRAEWVEPTHIGGMHATVRVPDADWLYEWLLPQEVLAYDTETDGLESLLAKVRCVSIGSVDTGVVIPFMSKIDPRHRFYSKHDEVRIIDVLRWWWTSHDHLKVGWNNGSYDRIVVEQNFGVTPVPILDCMMLHRVVDPELPHGLGFAASVYAALAPSWKANRAATEAESDAELHRYASLDAVQNMRLCEPLIAIAEQREQMPVFYVDVGMQSNAANLHRIGIKVDVTRRNQWETLLLQGGIDPVDEAKHRAKVGDFDPVAHVQAWKEWEVAGKPSLMEARRDGLPERPAGPRVHRGALYGSVDRPSYIEELRHHAGRSDLNPNSVNQIRDLLFEKWKLPVPIGSNDKPKLTKGGDYSTDDEAIRALLIHPLVRHDKKGCTKYRCHDCSIMGFLDALRFYRAKMKLWGTYIKRLVPNTNFVEADAFDMNVIDDLGRISRGAGNEIVGSELDDEYELAEEAAGELVKSKEKIRGFLWPDGRIRADWKAHVTAVGRFACSNMNLLNIPSELRDMLVPEPGHCFVGADADQIHMRIAASRWGLKKYLAVFERGGDPHALTSLIINGDRFRNAPGFPGGRWEGDIFIPDSTGKWDLLAKLLRSGSKTIFFASLYAATVETVWRIVTSTEDDEGNLIYADLKLESVRKMHKTLMAGLPELEAGWNSEIRSFRALGYIDEPVLGRRRDLLDLQYTTRPDEGKSDMVNPPILGAEGSIMSKATNAIVAEIPFNHAAKTGLVHQNYDSVCVEALGDIRDVRKAAKVGVRPARWEDETDPALREARRVCAVVQRCMTWTEPSLPGVIGTAVAQYGATLKEA